MCQCDTLDDLDLSTRRSFNRRIKETKTIVPELVKIDEHPDQEHGLFRCSECDQYWQTARAWNWGNEKYIFKVPVIASADWIAAPYMDPDEVFISGSVMNRFFEQTEALLEDPSKRACGVTDCSQIRLKFSALCIEHHVRQLQAIGTLPKRPRGRWFVSMPESLRAQEVLNDDSP